MEAVPVTGRPGVDFNPVCLHKEGETYKSRVATVCCRCYGFRHQHSDLELVETAVYGGIHILADVVVPRGASR